MRCHYKDEAGGRATLFTFNFIPEGFNQVYARDKQDAIEVAVDSFEGDDSTLKVNRESFREVKDVNSYYNNFPMMD
jgi:hypothetical protein